MEPQSNRSLAVKNGLVAAFAAIIFMLIIYIFNRNLFVGYIGFATFVIYLILMVMTGKAVKKNGGGYLRFREGLKYIYLVAIISVSVYSLFAYLMYTVIDPELVGVLKESSLEQSRKFMEWFNMPEEQMEKALEQAEEQDYAPNLKNTSLNLMFMFIVGFILSAIIALILKKNPPEELQRVES